MHHAYDVYFYLLENQYAQRKKNNQRKIRSHTQLTQNAVVFVASTKQIQQRNADSGLMDVTQAIDLIMLYSADTALNDVCWYL